MKKKVVFLYRHILKKHIEVLNDEMRVFGDFFVKSEFQLNYWKADEKQMETFYKQ